MESYHALFLPVSYYALSSSFASPAGLKEIKPLLVCLGSIIKSQRYKFKHSIVHFL